MQRLADIERPSASDGERRAAELIADELSSAGAENVRIEEAPAHGGYWWPLGIPTGAAAIAGLAAPRAVAALTGAVAAASVFDDLRFGQRRLRSLLPQRTTFNVVGELGPDDARRTLVFVSHHDAAHSGLVFNPAAGEAVGERFPDLVERTDTGPPLLWGAFGGPLLVALGALLGRRSLRALGTFLSAGFAATMADIGTRKVVPGANDNATACAVLVELARELAADPPADTRVMFVSTGSEESFSEGMVAWGRRHFPVLVRDTTTFVSLDSLGSPRLLALEGEGFLGVFDYPKEPLRVVKECADELGIYMQPNLRTRAGTDGLVPLLAGYRTISICSCNRFKQIPNYHWPTDTPENVEYEQVVDAVRLCRRLVERLP